MERSDKIMMYQYVCPKCGGDLLSIALTVHPPIPTWQCPRCGWSYEGKRETVARVPFPVEDKGEENHA